MIERSHYWKEHKEFTVGELARSLGVSHKQAERVVMDNREKLTVVPGKRGNGSTRYLYQRRPDGQRWLRTPWVSDWAVDRGLGPLEWRR